MALTIAPAEGYDSYVSIADADAYAASMGRSAWPADEADKETALRRATQYVRVTYSPKAEYLDPVHKNIEAATVEAALRSISGELMADVKPAAVIEKTMGPMAPRTSSSWGP